MGLIRLLALFPPALAGTLLFEAPGEPVVVLLDGQIVGPTPQRIELSAPGRHTVGFRGSMWGSTVFSEVLEVPQAGTLVVTVDLAGRRTDQRLGLETARAGALPPSPSEPPSASPPQLPVGDLYVDSTPASALILLDGAQTARETPALLTGVAPGAHVVLLRTDCARAEGEVNVRPGVITRLELELIEGAGAVTLTTDPPGATLLLDGQELGQTPAELPDLSCGEHRFVLRAPGRLEVTEVVEVRAFERQEVAITLPVEQVGALAVAPTPLEATVSLDGVVVGTGPRTIEPVGAGEHTIEVSLDGYTADRRVVTVEGDQVLRVDVALAPAQAAPSRRLPWGRLTLDVVATGAGGALAGHALYVYGQARLAYTDFISIDDDAEAETIYQEEVAPRRRQAIAEGAGAALVLAGSALLWAKTDFYVQATPTGITVAGRW